MSPPATHADDEPCVVITLTEVQVTQVLRAAGGGGGVAALLGGPGLKTARNLGARLQRLYADESLSHSSLRFVLLLAAFPADGTPRPITEVARELELSPSTAYRYASTAVQLGLLERDPNTRRYRLPRPALCSDAG